MTRLWPPVPAEQMTSRARAYLFIVFCYCIGMAIGLFCLPGWFDSRSFKFVMGMIPGHEMAWAVGHVFVGITAFHAARSGSPKFAYRALIGAAILVGIWASGFIWSASTALVHGEKASWSAVIAYSSLVATHIVQARQPLRSPFEPVLRKLDTGE